MKILLLGEFSSLHRNLQEGLIEIGHEVILASSGDGYRNVYRDIDLAKKNNLGLFKNAELFYRLQKITNNFKGYDVVQLMTPVAFPKKFGINKFLLGRIKDNNDKLFLVGAGATGQNIIIADFLKKQFKYPEICQSKLSDNKNLWSQTEEGRKYNEWFHELIDGYIPIMYEYAQGYRNLNYQKLKNTIPIPVNLDKIEYIGNSVKNKIVIFHGITREGKGTHIISKALENIQSRYPNEVEIILKGNMPLKEYLEILNKANIVIDQTYAVSYGVNAVYNLAKGKIVMGGGEDECLKEFGVTKSPLIPILPNVRDIEMKLEKLIEEKDSFEEQGYQSRLFAEKIHDYKKVAHQYVQTWNS